MRVLDGIRAWVRLSADILGALARHQRVLRQFPQARFCYPTNWIYDDLAAMSIEDDVWIGPFSEIVVLKRSGYSSVPGSLHLGKRVVIGPWANIRAAGGQIAIGENALLGQRVSLIASNHVLEGSRPYRDLSWDPNRTGITLAENVWIGAGATILPGCTIGANAVIAAGSVVTQSVPTSELWAGVPARLMRRLNTMNVDPA